MDSSCAPLLKRPHHFTVNVSSINVLFFEPDRYTDGFQFPDGFQAIPCIAGKPGDGFGKYPVYFPFTAVPEHPLKIFALIGRRPDNPSSA